MRIYFAADNQAGESFQQRFSEIIDLLSERGILVMSNLAAYNLSGFSAQDLEKMNQSGEVMLEKMDGLIIEGSRQIPETAYLVAVALAHQKPILYLSEKNKPINKNLVHLQKDKNAGKLLNLEYYNKTNLEKIIQEFLQQVEKGEGREAPTIKFTLRITPRIERYLHWKTHNTKISKADFLREMIEKMIDDDADYNKFFKK
ncbi:MAG: hypothetical protein RB292_05070 [Patescibacteria group bacterium]|jgi:hypothetical protein|nr:hypothetical protein [Patescibacteria group bacterium]